MCLFCQVLAKTESREILLNKEACCLRHYLLTLNLLNKADSITNHYKFDIIIIGGSYSGLSAAMVLEHLLKTG